MSEATAQRNQIALECIFASVAASTLRQASSLSPPPKPPSYPEENLSFLRSFRRIYASPTRSFVQSFTIV
ncbi:unnamed protein product [Cochlearia groenlandica]